MNNRPEAQPEPIISGETATAAVSETIPLSNSSSVPNSSSKIIRVVRTKSANGTAMYTATIPVPYLLSAVSGESTTPLGSPANQSQLKGGKRRYTHQSRKHQSRKHQSRKHQRRHSHRKRSHKRK